MNEDKELKAEAEAWEKTVDDVTAGKIYERAHIEVMQTPKVFNLIGAKSLPIYTDANKLLSALKKHPALTTDIIKQIPYAISDPVAIFRSATHPNDSIVVMTEVIDKDGGTVVVPVQLDVTQDSYKINRIASIYAKKNDKTGEIHNEWFVEQVNNGQLLYINNKKSSDWSNQAKLQLLSGNSNQNLYDSIPNENDLDKLLNPEIYNQAAYNPKKTLGEWLKNASDRVKTFLTSSVGITVEVKIIPPVESKTKTTERPSLTFENPETERRYRESQNGVRPLTLRQKINRLVRDIADNFKGDYAELGRRRDLYAAREEFRQLKNRISAAAKKALKSFNENLGRLNDYENELFGRARLLDDLAWRKGKRPEALLPFGFDDKSLQKEHKRFNVNAGFFLTENADEF